MQEEDLDLERDNDVNWPDLSINRPKSVTLLRSVTQLMPKANSRMIGLALSTTSIGGASTSKAQSNGTINASLPKEHGNGTVNAEIDTEKHMHEKKAVHTGSGGRS